MSVSSNFARSGSFSQVGMQERLRSNSAPVMTKELKYSSQQNTKVTRELAGEHEVKQPGRTPLKHSTQVPIKQGQVKEEKPKNYSDGTKLQGNETKCQPDNDNPIMQNQVIHTEDFLSSVNLVLPMPVNSNDVLSGTNLSSNVVNTEKVVTLQSDVTSTVVEEVTSTSFWSCLGAFFRGAGTVLSAIGDGLGWIGRGLWWGLRNGGELLGYGLCCLCWCASVTCGDD